MGVDLERLERSAETPGPVLSDGRTIHAVVAELRELRAARDAVLAIHREEQFGPDRVCSSCLRYTTPLPGRVPYPCPTVRALTTPGDIPGFEGTTEALAALTIRGEQ